MTQDNKQPKEEWEKEFDDEYCEWVEITDIEGQDQPMQRVSPDIDAEWIKDFIREQIKKAEGEIIDYIEQEVEVMKNASDITFVHRCNRLLENLNSKYNQHDNK